MAYTTYPRHAVAVGAELLRNGVLGMAHQIDGDAVAAFCEERAERMKNPLTAAIYAGLRDRIRRGQFDIQKEQER